MSAYIEDWTCLAGRIICIRRNGRPVRIGLVEAVTPAGDMLWLRRGWVEPRALFQKECGYTAWIPPDAPYDYPPIDHVYLS
ncbi:hypothetical protein StoSoilA2_18930 [Arthrobacter sp. StoSoilA2]|nr:hypothetical protein StoSoilA2_18930 [Arthrobacter sp. StoSoilA2]